MTIINALNQPVLAGRCIKSLLVSTFGHCHASAVVCSFDANSHAGRTADLMKGQFAMIHGITMVNLVEDVANRKPRSKERQTALLSRETPEHPGASSMISRIVLMFLTLFVC